MSNLYSVVLAAGQGKRMKSELPKVLHQISGVPMIGHIVNTLKELRSDKIITVVGHKAELVIDYIGENSEYVEQKEQLGTGHAVLQAHSMLKNEKGITLVVNGDTPLLTKETLSELIHEHKNSGASATILTTEIDNPKGYGRIIRGSNGEVVKIVEQKDATNEEKRVKEVNSGTYCFDNETLFEALAKVKNDNNQNEYYLTDVIEILRADGHIVSAYQTFDTIETTGINDRVALAKAESALRLRVVEEHMRNGVTIIDPNHTYIEKSVEIDQDTIIYPGTYLKGNTVIKSNCEIGPNVDLTDIMMEKNVTISHTVAISSKIEESAKIGPFAYIRPGSTIGKFVKIGDFVEIKNSTIGERSKVPHLSYIGDAVLGEDINIGCGTITVNYDGFEKHQTKIGDRAFVGCNSNLVAPVSVGNDAYVAAGSTITEHVPDFSLSIARQRQTNKEDYVKKIREAKKK